MRTRRARMQVAQHGELVRGRLRRFGERCRKAYRPTGLCLDLLLRDGRMDRGDGHFLRYRIGLKHAEVCDQLGWPLGLEPEAGAMIAALAVAHGGDEIELRRKGARRLVHDDEDLAAG